MGRKPKHIFSKEDTEVTNGHIKRFSVPLIIREIQTKTTMSYYLTPIRMAVIKKYTNKKCHSGCGEKRIYLRCW